VGPATAGSAVGPATAGSAIGAGAGAATGLGAGAPAPAGGAGLLAKMTMSAKVGLAVLALGGAGTVAVVATRDLPPSAPTVAQGAGTVRAGGPAARADGRRGGHGAAAADAPGDATAAAPQGEPPAGVPADAAGARVTTGEPNRDDGAARG